MKKLILITFLFLIFLSSCTGAIEMQKRTAQDGGKIITATQLPTSWNQTMKMQITTDKYIFIVDGNHSVKLGAQTTIISGNTRYYSKSCLRVDNAVDCWDIYK